MNINAKETDSRWLDYAYADYEDRLQLTYTDLNPITMQIQTPLYRTVYTTITLFRLSQTHPTLKISCITLLKLRFIIRLPLA